MSQQNSENIFVQLYQKYYGTEDLDKITELISTTGHQRVHTPMPLRGLESALLYLSQSKGCMATINFAFHKFCEMHPSIFSDRSVLELGPGGYIDQALIRTCKTYRGADVQYPPLEVFLSDFAQRTGKPLDKISSRKKRRAEQDFINFLSKRVLGKKQPLLYTPADRSDTKMPEYSTETGRIILVAGDFINIDAQCQYEVIINTSLGIRDKKYMEKIKQLLCPDGVYIEVDVPILWTAEDRLHSRDFFQTRMETWLEIIPSFRRYLMSCLATVVQYSKNGADLN